MPKTHASTRLDMFDMGYIIEDWLDRHGMGDQRYYQDQQSGVTLEMCHGLTDQATLFFKKARAKKEYEKLVERVFEVNFPPEDTARMADLEEFLGIETMLSFGVKEEVKHLRRPI